MKRTLAIASLSLVAAAAPGLAAAAYYYEATTTVESTNGKGSTSTSSVHGWVDGENARVEFQQRDVSGMFAAGSYLLSNDGGGTVYVVNPDKKTISEIDLSQIAQVIGTVANATGGLVKMEFSDFTGDKPTQDPGEPILGYDTTHYHVKSGYTMKFGVLGFAREDHIEADHDFYCANKLDMSGFAVWLRPDKLHTGNEGMDKLIAQQYANVHCLPLRSRVVTTMTGEHDKQSTTTTRTEVTTLRQGSAPAGTFQLPADYKNVPLVPDLSSSAGANSSENSSQKEEKKRPRLKDLFGR